MNYLLPLSNTAIYPSPLPNYRGVSLIWIFVMSWSLITNHCSCCILNIWVNVLLQEFCHDTASSEAVVSVAAAREPAGCVYALCVLPQTSSCWQWGEHWAYSDCLYVYTATRFNIKISICKLTGPTGHLQKNLLHCHNIM